MKNIAIIAGGDTSEHDVSIRSAEGLLTFIDDKQYNIFVVEIKKNKWTVKTSDGSTYDIDKNDFSFQVKEEKITFDYAYITIHGHPGENGYMQGYLGMMGIPHSSCALLPSALTYNKYVVNYFLRSQGINTSDSILVRRNQTIEIDAITAKLGLPVFVKPNEGGSSFGTTKVKEASQMQEALKNAFNENSDAIIEKFVKGIEVTCGCYKTKSKSVVFPITEVVTDNDFFDYGAKYNGEVREITPARIPDEQAKKISEETLKIYDLIAAHGIIRIDYIIPDNGNPVLLDINTNPGMTATSFIPQQVRAAGLDIKNVMTEIIEDI